MMLSGSAPHLVWFLPQRLGFTTDHWEIRPNHKPCFWHGRFSWVVSWCLDV